MQEVLNWEEEEHSQIGDNPDCHQLLTADAHH